MRNSVAEIFLVLLKYDSGPLKTSSRLSVACRYVTGGYDGRAVDVTKVGVKRDCDLVSIPWSLDLLDSVGRAEETVFFFLRNMIHFVNSFSWVEMVKYLKEMMSRLLRWLWRWCPLRNNCGDDNDADGDVRMDIYSSHLITTFSIIFGILRNLNITEMTFRVFCCIWKRVRVTISIDPFRFT